MIIGIDFGTCYSAVAIMAGSRPIADVFGNEEGIPTQFMYSSEQKKELFGGECYCSEGFSNPESVIKYMKRMIRDRPENINASVVSNGKSYTVREVVEKYINYLITEIKNVAKDLDFIENKEIERVTITAPVGLKSGTMLATNYNSFIRSIVKDVTKLDDNHVSVLHEPVAAAINYMWNVGLDWMGETKTFMVFDLGGGTLDITIGQYNPEKRDFDTIVRKGDLYLGGNDWDDAIAQDILGRCNNPTFASKRLESEFKIKINKLKHDLTRTNSSGLFAQIDDKGNNIMLMYSRAEFEKASKHLLDRAMALVQEAIKSYGKDLSTIDNIVLVGGSSNMPQIADGLKKTLKGYDPEKIFTYDVSKSIAKGAAISARLEHPHIPEPKAIKIRHRAKQTYGFRSNNISLEKEMIYNMIFINTLHPQDDNNNYNEPIIVRTETSFSPLENDQTRVVFQFYESSHEPANCIDGNWSELGNGEKANDLVISIPVPSEYVKKKEAKKYNLWPELQLDVDGVLTVRIYDETGKCVGSEPPARKGSE